MRSTTVNDDGFRRSLTVSAGLHLFLILFMYFGLPQLMKPLPKPYVPIPFEIVDIGEITNTRVKQPDEPPQPPAPPPAPEVKAAAPTPPAPVPPPEKVEAIAMPKPAEKPKPPEEVKPKQDNNFSKLLKDISKLKPQETSKASEAKPEIKQSQQTSALSPALSERLSISEEDALRRQIQQCWNMPIGARDAHNLVVDVVIDVMLTWSDPFPDGTVRAAEVFDKARMAMDSFFRSAGESAIRALYNPKCSPLELPPDKYEQWKRITFTFNPRDML